MRITQRDPELASLGRRMCSTGIDLACVACATGGMVGGGLLWDRIRRGQMWKGMDGIEERVTRFQESLGWRRVQPVLAFATAVSRRNWRSVGMYLMDIRRADVHTGGPVTVRSALIRHLVGWGVVRLASRRLLLPRIGRIQAQMRALHKDVEAARQQHPDDRQAEQQAIRQIYQNADVNPTSCCWLPLLPVIINGLVMLATPRHQSPADWLAGIVTVKD